MIGTYPCLLGLLIPLSQLAQSGFLLFSQIRKLLDLGLIESVNYRVLSLFNTDSLDLELCQQIM